MARARKVKVKPKGPAAAPPARRRRKVKVSRAEAGETGTDGHDSPKKAPGRSKDRAAPASKGPDRSGPVLPIPEFPLVVEPDGSSCPESFLKDETVDGEAFPDQEAASGHKGDIGYWEDSDEEDDGWDLGWSGGPGDDPSRTTSASDVYDPSPTGIRGDDYDPSPPKKEAYTYDPSPRANGADFYDPASGGRRDPARGSTSDEERWHEYAPAPDIRTGSRETYDPAPGRERGREEEGPGEVSGDSDGAPGVICNQCGEFLPPFTRVCEICGYDLYRHDPGAYVPYEGEEEVEAVEAGPEGFDSEGGDFETQAWDRYLIGRGGAHADDDDDEDDIDWSVPIIISDRPEIPVMQAVATFTLMGLFIMAHWLRPEVLEVMGGFSGWIEPQTPALAAVLAAAAGFFFVTFPRLDYEVQTTVKRSALIIFLLALLLPPLIILAATEQGGLAGAALMANLDMLARMLLVVAYWAPVSLGVYGIWTRRPTWVGASAVFMLAIPAFSDIITVALGGTVASGAGEVGTYLAFALMLFIYTELADGSHRFYLLSEPRDGSGPATPRHLHHVARLLQRYFTFMTLFVLMCALVVFFVLNMGPLAEILGPPEVAGSLELTSVFGTVLMFIYLGVALFTAACVVRWKDELSGALTDLAARMRGLGEGEEEGAVPRSAGGEGSDGGAGT